MTKRDEQIILHIARHRLSIRPILAELFFGGNESACDNVIRRLRKAGHIESIDGLPDGFSYYRLTKEEAKRRSVPENRTELEPKALQTWFSVLWFCCMGEKRRHVLEGDQLKKYFGRSFNVPYVVEKEGEAKWRIYRVFTPDDKRPLNEIVSDIHKDLAEAEKFSLSVTPYTGAELLRLRLYAVAVLVGNEKRCSELRTLVKAEESNLMQRAHVIVETVASPGTLQEAIHEKRPEPAADSPTPAKSPKHGPRRRH